MGESKVQKEFKTSTFACTQYYMLMTTLSLRNSILSLMLIGGMAVSVNSFAQGRRGGFGGTRQSPSVQQSRTTATERRSNERATATQSRSSYGRSSATQSRSSECSTVAPSRTPQGYGRATTSRSTERVTAQPRRYNDVQTGRVTPRSAERNTNPQRYNTGNNANQSVRQQNVGTAERRPGYGTATPQKHSDYTTPQRYNTGNNANQSVRQQNVGTAQRRPGYGTTTPQKRSDNNAFQNGVGNRFDETYRPEGNNGRGDRPNGNNNGNNGNHYGNDRGDRPNGNYGNHYSGHRDYGRDYDGRRPGYHNPHHSNPRGYDNQFNRRYHDYYRHNSWSWSHPCRPPYRPWRPTPWVVHRPVVPAGWVWYSSAPRIYRVLGIQFGTVFSVSINHLFTYGYNIDGYYDNVIYLRDVPMLNYSWPNVMLNYAPGGGLASAMFSNSFAFRDLAMYNRLYNTLCGTYGSPVDARTTPYEGTVSWWGGEGQGYVTLTYYTDQNGRFYTNLTIGN